MDVRRVEPGLRSESVRRANLSAVARKLHDSGSLSRSQLGVRTGLTRSTIRALIGEFVAADLVSETPGPLGTPGRPSVLVNPNPGRPLALALEIEVDSIAAAIVGFGGRVHQVLRVERPRGELSVEQTVADLSALARRLDGFADVRTEAVGIGVAVAGVVRQPDGLVLLAPNLGWRDVALGHALRQALGSFVPISIANDADLGALAEARRGAARGSDNILYVSGAVGVGGGIIVDGRALAGVAGYGGEVGHLPMEPDGAQCRCGARGCWETLIGEDALLVRAGRARGGGREAVDAVLADARDGDAAAVEAVEHVCRWLGYGLGGLANVLNPERIVLGGIFGRLEALAGSTIRSELDRHSVRATRELVTVVPAQLAEEAPLLGAAELAFEAFLADPAAWLRPEPTLAIAAGE